MKRIFPVLVAVFTLVSTLAFAVPVMADQYQEGTDVVYNGWYVLRTDIDNVPLDPSSIDLSRVEVVDGLLLAYATSYESVFSSFLGGGYIVPTGVLVDTSFLSISYADSFFFAVGELFSPFFGSVDGGSVPFRVPAMVLYFDNFRVSAANSIVGPAEFAKFMLFYEELPGNPFVEEDSSANTVGVYPAIYDILADAFYGDGAELTGDQTLVLTVLSTFAIVLMFALPFLLVWFFVRMFTRF